MPQAKPQSINKEEHDEHDVPAGGYFTPKLYLQRYHFVKKLISELNAKTVIDLGCAECKFVKELAMMNLRRVIGIDLDGQIIKTGSNYFKPNFDDCYNLYYHRKEPLLIELYKGNACQTADPRLLGVDFVSCIELIEHINPEDHPGIIKTIFNDIKPLYAVITTPNSEFNSHWQRMPHGKYRHEDHRFEWTRVEFKAFVSNILKEYPEYVASFDGIGPHWGGDTSKGFCSQAAIFTLTNISPTRTVMTFDEKNFDKLRQDNSKITDATYEKIFSMIIRKHDFDHPLLPVNEHSVPNLNWTTSGDHLAQPNYLIAEDGQSPYITFTDEDFDYDRLSIFHENIMAWVAVNRLDRKDGSYTAGDYCLTKGGDGNYYRVKILHYESPNIAKYLLIDFGSVEIGRHDELRDIPNYSDFRTRPSSTVSCQINGENRLNAQSREKLSNLISSSFNDTTNEIEIYWKLNIAYLDKATCQHVCDIYIRRAVDSDYVSLIDVLLDPGGDHSVIKWCFFDRKALKLQTRKRSTRNMGRAIYHLGHYFWVTPNTNGDFTIY